METKYAGTGNNTKIDSNYGNDSFSRDENYNEYINFLSDSKSVY